MGIKQALLECIPDAYYSDGTKANCIIFKVWNMLDIDPQSYKEVKEKKDMDDKKEESTYAIDFDKLEKFRKNYKFSV